MIGDHERVWIGASKTECRCAHGNAIRRVPLWRCNWEDERNVLPADGNAAHSELGSSADISSTRLSVIDKRWTATASSPKRAAKSKNSCRGTCTVAQERSAK